MNVKSFLVVVAILAIVMPLRSDTPKPPPAAGQSFEQMIADLKQIGELVQQLDDKNFAKRQEASERLMHMGKPAVEPLQRLLASKPSLEMATRIQGVLREIKKQQRAKSKLRTTLAQRINLEKGIEPNTPLKDALDFLSERYDLTIVVDEESFSAIGVQKASEQPVQLPKLVNVPLRIVLRWLVGQIKGDVYTGTLLIRGDYIEVTTTYKASPEAWGHGPSPVRIDAEFDGEELEIALQVLAESSGINVVLDRRVADKVREKVTASLDEVPLDTAVRLLADMAGLKVVAMPHAHGPRA